MKQVDVPARFESLRNQSAGMIRIAERGIKDDMCVLLPPAPIGLKTGKGCDRIRRIEGLTPRSVFS